jgi:NTE family protein
MQRALVLGGGGLVGMGYHAGALKALAEWGVDAASADLVVGTSAGAVIAAYLASGWSAEDFYDYAHGRHPRSGEPRDEAATVFQPLWYGPGERLRRGLGSLFAAASARGLTLGVEPPRALRRLFPSGLYSTTATRLRLVEDLGEDWPARPLLICAADLYSGARVAFGSPGAPEAPFADAVAASTAIPGVFPPVRIGSRHYVDGGIVSATSLDLAVAAGCRSILCIAPLGFRADTRYSALDPKAWGPMLVRSPFGRVLRKEVRAARAAGAEVFVIRPWIGDLKELGSNSMRLTDRVRVAEGARRGTLRLLEEHGGHPALQALKGARR